MGRGVTARAVAVLTVGVCLAGCLRIFGYQGAERDAGVDGNADAGDGEAAADGDDAEDGDAAEDADGSGDGAHVDGNFPTYDDLCDRGDRIGCDPPEPCTCASGCCDIRCSSVPGCVAICEDGAACKVSCTEGSCEATCRAGATCELDCSGGGCSILCEAGSFCTVPCAGGGCSITCEPGARCRVGCAGTSCTCDPPSLC